MFNIKGTFFPLICTSCGSVAVAGTKRCPRESAGPILKSRNGRFLAGNGPI